MAIRESETRQVHRILAHPLVLRSAWRRVRRWLSYGIVRDEMDFASWRTNPDQRIYELAKTIDKGEYRPSPFVLVPHPKKNSVLRHYLVPSIDDQVVFTAFGILLAPYLEQKMPNISFGNRWYRGLYYDARAEDPKWKNRNFSLSDGQLYQPFQRAHGLYKRVAHWSVARMLGAEINRGGSTGPALEPKDFTESTLPPFANREWWEGNQSDDGPGRKGTREAYWCALDMRLAYPSVQVDILEKRLKRLLKENIAAEGAEAFGLTASEKSPDYPTEIRAWVDSYAFRKNLATHLCEYLQSIEYVDVTGLEEKWHLHWCPDSVQQRLPNVGRGRHTGLPTGLCISGLLLNVYLSELDRRMIRWIIERREDGDVPPVYLRFSDDMTVIAPDRQTLFDAVDEIWYGANSGDEVIELADDVGSANLCLNWAKVGPAPINEAVQEYLDDHDWEQCPDCERITGPPTPKDGQPIATMSLSEWWQNDGEKKLEGTSFEDARLDKDRLGPFVTYLVERMSALGREGFDERFGNNAQRRLTELHELIRFDFDDEQVRADTRMAFATNRLVRAWLPSGELGDQKHSLRELRRSIRKAVLEYPWKVKQWRNVVRMAVRRPFPPTSDGDPKGYSPTDEQDEAESWFKSMLALIAIREHRTERQWLYDWPEEDRPECCTEATTDTWKRLYLSYLRALFWSNLAHCILTLRRQTTVRNEADSSKQCVSSRHWLFRALPEHEYKRVHEWISDIDEWARWLYPDPPGDFELWPWEQNGIIQALLATGTASSMLRSGNQHGRDWLQPIHQAVHGNEKSRPFSVGLGTPRELLDGASFLKGLLAHYVEQVRQDSPEAAAIAQHLTFCPRDEDDFKRELGDSSLTKWATNGRGITGCDNLGLLGHIPTALADTWSKKLKGKFESLVSESDNFTHYRILAEYRSARRLLMSLNRRIQGTDSQRATTLYDVLWGSPCAQPWSFSPPRPATNPRIGLPTRVALFYLHQALSTDLDDDGDASNDREAPPIWCFSQNAQSDRSALVAGRLLQFGNETAPSETPGLDELHVSHHRKSWPIPPHPLYLVPIALYGVRFDSLAYRGWVHVLHLLVALVGHERFLDRAFHRGFGTVDFVDRWHLRSRIHLPPEIWRKLEAVLRFLDVEWGKTDWGQMVLWEPDDDPRKAVPRELKELHAEIEAWLSTEAEVGIADFGQERVDVQLELKRDYEQIRSIRRYTSTNSPDENPPDDIPMLNKDSLADAIQVRIGQLSAAPNWQQWLNRFPELSRDEIEETMRQVVGAITNVPTSHEDRPDLLVLPEILVPHREVNTLRTIVQSTETAILTGLMWRKLPTVVPPHESLAESSTVTEFFVNEASLLVPLSKSSRIKSPTVREFRIRKPRPARLEYGLAAYLSNQSKDNEAKGKERNLAILPGHRWFRFVHPKWGDFTVGICADLIDPEPWHSFQGEILHLFLSAFNKDINLFDSLSWVRAYENFANVVVANHGSKGGSFVWSPRRKHKKEIARLRGESVLVTADVELPVRELYEVQVEGDKLAEEKMVKSWKKVANPPDKRPLSQRYKSIPPTFRRKVVSERTEANDEEDTVDATDKEEQSDDTAPDVEPDIAE